MTDGLLTDNDREEELSRAYVHAVAAMAGYLTADYRPDRDGADVQIRAGGSMRPSLDIQLKATIKLGAAENGKFRYPLKRRNYDLLRAPTMVPNWGSARTSAKRSPDLSTSRTGSKITLKTLVEGRPQSVSAKPDEVTYAVAVQAHKSKRPVIMTGDLKRLGQRWRMENPDLREIPADDAADDEAAE